MPEMMFEVNSSMDVISSSVGNTNAEMLSGDGTTTLEQINMASFNSEVAEIRRSIENVVDRGITVRRLESIDGAPIFSGLMFDDDALAQVVESISRGIDESNSMKRIIEILEQQAPLLSSLADGSVEVENTGVASDAGTARSGGSRRGGASSSQRAEKSPRQKGREARDKADALYDPRALDLTDDIQAEAENEFRHAMLEREGMLTTWDELRYQRNKAYYDEVNKDYHHEYGVYRKLSESNDAVRNAAKKRLEEEAKRLEDEAKQREFFRTPSGLISAFRNDMGIASEIAKGANTGIGPFGGTIGLINHLRNGIADAGSASDFFKEQFGEKSQLGTAISEFGGNLSDKLAGSGVKSLEKLGGAVSKFSGIASKAAGPIAVGIAGVKQAMEEWDKFAQQVQAERNKGIAVGLYGDDAFLGGVREGIDVKMQSFGSGLSESQVSQIRQRVSATLGYKGGTTEMQEASSTAMWLLKDYGIKDVTSTNLYKILVQAGGATNEELRDEIKKLGNDIRGSALNMDEVTEQMSKGAAGIMSNTGINSNAATGIAGTMATLPASNEALKGAFEGVDSTNLMHVAYAAGFANMAENLDLTIPQAHGFFAAAWVVRCAQNVVISGGETLYEAAERLMTEEDAIKKIQNLIDPMSGAGKDEKFVAEMANAAGSLAYMAFADQLGTIGISVTGSFQAANILAWGVIMYDGLTAGGASWDEVYDKYNKAYEAAQKQQDEAGIDWMAEHVGPRSDNRKEGDDNPFSFFADIFDMGTAGQTNMAVWNSSAIRAAQGTGPASTWGIASSLGAEDSDLESRLPSGGDYTLRNAMVTVRSEVTVKNEAGDKVGEARGSSAEITDDNQ